MQKKWDLSKPAQARKWLKEAMGVKELRQANGKFLTVEEASDKQVLCLVKDIVFGQRGKNRKDLQ